jgi:hypothetical protein
LPAKNTPKLGQQIHGGLCAGVANDASGAQCAVVLLPDTPDQMDWYDAMQWAAGLGATLPSRAVSSLLFDTLPDHFQHFLYWTCDQESGSTAWAQTFYNGDQNDGPKSTLLRARAVRLVALQPMARAEWERRFAAHLMRAGQFPERAAIVEAGAAAIEWSASGRGWFDPEGAASERLACWKDAEPA